jgi:hypothetical protein
MRIKSVLFAAACCLLISASPVHAKKSKVIEVYGGMVIPGVGLAIDASYDQRLDNFVPGYKVLNVAIVNSSFEIIAMDPARDKWLIEIKGDKRKYEAITDLRNEDPQAWNQIPMRARGIIGYPLALPIGARQVIDLFVPESVKLEQFNKLIVKINSLGVTFKINPRQ